MLKDQKSSSRLGSYAVHIFTASGGCFALLALHAIAAERLQLAFAWMSVAVIIDAVDGFLARKLHVKKGAPEIDGALLDMMVDFLNYVIVPAFLLFESELLPEFWKLPLGFAVVLLSALQFSHVNAKTDDNFFQGFPSYWNIVVFYLVLLNFPQLFNVALLIILLVLTPMPHVYLYPSKMAESSGSQTFRKVFLALSVLWGLSLLMLLWQYPQPNSALLLGNLAYVALYFERSFAANRQRSREKVGD